MVEEFHDEWMDGEPKTTLESSLIEAHFSRREMVGFFPFSRKTNLDFLEELESIPKPKKGVSIKGAIFPKGMEGPDLPPSRRRRA